MPKHLRKPRFRAPFAFFGSSNSPLILLLTLGFTVAFGLPADAQQTQVKPQPLQQQNATALWFENWVGLSNATLTVVGPDGNLTQIFTASGTPVYQLGQDRASNSAPLPDGIYTFELTAAGDAQVQIVNPIDNGRGEAARNSHATPFNMTGYFTVSRGVIIPPEDIQETDG